MRPVKDSDFVEINTWIKARGLETKQKPSTIGVIEPGVCCCFLYITDSNWAIMDYMISNPDAPSKARDEAAYKIGESLVALAKELGFELIWWITENENMIRRGIKAGYKAQPVTLFTKEI